MLIKNGEAKIADFGLTRRADPSTPSTFSGTIQYAAPEVLLQGDVARSEASDMFSFGMLFFHVVEEDIPWRGRDRESIVSAVCAGQLPARVADVWRSNDHLERYLEVR